MKHGCHYCYSHRSSARELEFLHYLRCHFVVDKAGYGGETDARLQPSKSVASVCVVWIVCANMIEFELFKGDSYVEQHRNIG